MAREPEGAYFAAGDGEKFEFVQERNVIVVGRSGVGKSMLLNQITGGSFMEFSHSPDARTKGATILAGHIKYKEKKYYCTFIDTVGFSDTLTRQTNDAIMQEIKLAMRDRKQIHLVIFTFRFREYYDRDKKQWALFIKNFKDTIYNVSAAVITHCDDYKDESKEDLKRELLEKEETKPFFSLMSKGIHCVGFPDTRKINHHDDTFKNIDRDANEIRELIAKSAGSIITEQIIKPSACTIA